MSEALEEEAGRPRRHVKLIVALIVVAAAAVAIAGFATNWFGLASVKGGGLDTYSWSELAKISDEIAAAGNDADALQIEKDYGLVDENGKLNGSQSKSLELSDGTQTYAQIAGFRHDDKTDGNGKAGITFILADAVAEHDMDDDNSNVGGWEKSDMRSWVNVELMAKLPEELQSEIVSVEKASNNDGKSTDASSVTNTSDRLWLFSSRELFGKVSWYTHPEHNAVLNAEGEQYQLFSDCGVSAEKGGRILSKTFAAAVSETGNCTPGEACKWWHRSPTPHFTDNYLATEEDGGPQTRDYGADYAEGVVVGFCL